ncbi:MAG: DUF4369 domain-containing protein, partial [Marinifilaceae bacterium]
MRKTVIALAALATVLTSCQPKFTINGSVSNLKSDMVYLKEFKDNVAVTIDSAKVIDNKFVFSGVTDITKRCFLFTDKTAKRPITEIYVENTDISIKLDIEKPKDVIITGGKAQAIVNKFRKIQDSLNSAVEVLNEKYKALIPQKEVLADKFEEEVKKIQDEYKA